MNPELQAVVEAVCEAFRVRPDEIMGRLGDQRVAWPRLVAYHVLRERTGWPYPEIGAAFGRDHSTVHKGIQQVVRRCRISSADREMVADVMADAEARRGSDAQAQDAARIALRTAISRIDRTVEAALERRARLVSALSQLDPPIIRQRAS